jgi:uncharacterized protein
VRTGVFDRIAASFERLEVRVDEMFDAADRVVVLGYYDGTYRGTSLPAKSQVAHIWTLSNGRPVRFQQYVDTLRIAETAKAAANRAAGSWTLRLASETALPWAIWLPDL